MRSKTSRGVGGSVPMMLTPSSPSCRVQARQVPVDQRLQCRQLFVGLAGELPVHRVRLGGRAGIGAATTGGRRELLEQLLAVVQRVAVGRELDLHEFGLDRFELLA